MGGLQCFGAVRAEPDEPVFHERWEARMFGLRRAMTSPPGFSIDRFRYLRETMPPIAYLAWSYYEHWYFATVLSLLQAGMVSEEEVLSGHTLPGRKRRSDAQEAATVAVTFRSGGRFDRALAFVPAFAVGQTVRAKVANPTGHTRLPRYVRGKDGVVHHHHGAHVLPDSNAMGKGEIPEHLYSVMFPARVLWGAEASPQDKIYVDLWESYLVPA
jgi:nitrile hydratase